MEYQICNRCIMDNQSDPMITFDEMGYCNYCRDSLAQKEYTYFPNEEGRKRLNELIHLIKQQGDGKKYDCLMGLSGGLDSSYLAFLGVKWGLRILAVHIDDGFDTKIAMENIRKLSSSLSLEITTLHPDEEQFNDLTKAYILAGVPNLAIPQDNILFAYLYKLAKKHNIKYFLSGGNFALESILQQGNSHPAFDLINIKDIHKRFGTSPIDKLEFLSERKRIIDRFIYGIKTVKPLNYIDYRRDIAIHELKEFCDYNYYEAKHLENILTKVVQLYWFYHKFGVDKRKSHLSSLIISGQVSREDALIEMGKPLYDETDMKKDVSFVLDKIKISKNNFEKIVNENGHQHTEYKTSTNYILKFARKSTFFNKMKQR